ncbi:MAG: hypothetical protein LKF69_03090 [Bacilli bacterium]|jgi:hypothetical protein|nr:hypothetical protein [Bacilli bacterium]MCH4202188.1 hypothetical protein [Bacilli bacterium]MCH4235766.1 hypothetical protein [Bacilli bacterium]
MNYEEFADLKTLPNSPYPLMKGYLLEDGSKFILEPAFYTQLLRFFDRYPEHIADILKEMKATVKKNKQVIFCSDYENCPINDKSYVLRELIDITDALKLFVDDISRGSDYGD